MNKRGVKFGIVLFSVIISIFLVSTIFAETPAEEKARLEQELSDLETQLAQIDNENFAKFHFGYADYFFQKSVGGIHSTNLTFFKVLNGTWVNFSCSVSSVSYDNYKCDNQTGYYAVNYFNPMKGDIDDN